MFKDWKTTLTAVIATLVTFLGLLLPDTFTNEAQEVVNSIWNELLIIIGMVANLINGWRARDKS